MVKTFSYIYSKLLIKDFKCLFDMLEIKCIVKQKFAVNKSA